jgi:hypothetical protein
MVKNKREMHQLVREGLIMCLQVEALEFNDQIIQYYVLLIF